MADTVYNSTGGVNATTPTDPTKKKNLNLPYMQTGQNQVMPLASTAVNAGANAQGQPTGQLAPVQPMQVQPLSPIQYFTDQQKAENEKKTENSQEARVNNTYQQATQQKQDPLQSLIGNTYAQQIQDYGQNAQQNVQNTLENYDVQKAKAFEAARQAGAGAADSGIFQNDLLQIQLQNLRDRGNLEQQTKTSNLENLNKVLSGAQTASTQQQTANDQFIKNLISATQAGDGEANRQQTAQENALNRAQELLVQANDIQGNKDIETLKAKFAEGAATTAYERQQATDALNRAHDIALQQGDIAGQLAVEKLQGEIQSQIEKEKQIWQTGERVASQIFSTTERLSTQDYESGQNYLDRENQKSMQMQDYYNNLNMQSNEFNQQKTMAQINSDLEEAKANNDFGRTQILEKLKGQIEAGLQDDAQASAKELAQLEMSNQRYIADQNAQLQIKMQLQGFDHDSQMKYLDAQIAETKASGDTERSKQLMSYQTQLNLQELGAKAGYEEKKAYLDNDLAKALQDNDAEHAEVLQRARLDQEAQQFSEEMIIKRAAQALEEKKVDIAQVENDYNKVVEMFGEDSEAAHEFLLNTLNANGIDTSGNEYAFVDATEQAKKALQAEYDLQKDQFMQSHPEYYQSNYIIAGQEISMSDLLSLNPGMTEDYIRNTFEATEPKFTQDGLVAMNEYINSAIYGEETAAQKEAKKTAGYLVNNAANTANVGDSLNITEATKTTAGQTLPVGLYDVINKASSKSDLWRSRTDNVVIARNRETGQEYEIRTDKGGESKSVGSKLLDPLGIFG